MARPLHLTSLKTGCWCNRGNGCDLLMSDWSTRLKFCENVEQWGKGQKSTAQDSPKGTVCCLPHGGPIENPFKVLRGLSPILPTTHIGFLFGGLVTCFPVITKHPTSSKLQGEKVCLGSQFEGPDHHGEVTWQDFEAASHIAFAVRTQSDKSLRSELASSFLCSPGHNPGVGATTFSVSLPFSTILVR